MSIAAERSPEVSKKSTRSSVSASTSEPLSVTLLSTEHLPSYSSERFFLLSELEIHAHSTNFLCDLDIENETNDTEDLSTDSGNGDHGNDDHTHSTLPTFCLVYLLWKPGMTTSAQVFMETDVLDAVTRVESLVDVVNSTETAKALRGRPVPPAKHSTFAALGNDTNHSNDREKCSIYLIVDRVEPPEKKQRWSLDATKEAAARERFHQVQRDLAEQLARKVAAHAKLRHLCEGITVGVSDHERAAPGLEAAANAVNVGAKDRRKEYQAHPDQDNDKSSRSNSSGIKSSVGLLAVQPSDCLGIQSENVTDAAQGVLQTRVCAEWNGQGNLQTFAARAQAAWRIQHGLLPDQDLVGPRRRKIPRRERHGDAASFDEAAMDRAVQDVIIDTLAAVLLAFYITFHFRDDLKEFFGFFNPRHVDDLIQKLREL